MAGYLPVPIVPFLSPNRVPVVRRNPERFHCFRRGSGGVGRKWGRAGAGNEELEVLFDDGYGSVGVKDYFDAVRDVTKPDGGPPRWFCPVECGPPIKGAPLLLFLPGLSGSGMGLIKHHKSLGRVFEVRCIHVPFYDQTPFEGLVNFIELSVKYEHLMSQNTPIYLVGDSFGGCLALAIAARNPSIDLILILSNPATSYARSPLQQLLPILKALPNGLNVTVPYLLSFLVGDPVKLAVANVADRLPPSQTVHQLRWLTSLLEHLSYLTSMIPRETFLWKLELLKYAASYANSRLHAIRAEVLVLCSGKDNILPSGDEGKRLYASLKDCRVRYFKDNGHTLLLEDGISLLTIIKGTNMYRRSRQHDYVSDYLPPSLTECKELFDDKFRWFRLTVSPVMLSTLKNGRVVRGLSGVPDEGPVLLVGNHMLLGIEMGLLVEEFLREKKVVIHGMAHPLLFSRQCETYFQKIPQLDLLKVFGALPVSAANMYKLFSRKSFVLLYPGGAREALHRKGEQYMLFWPDQPEFIRMAARFGVTIVPFGAVGEEDLVELVLDYNDIKGFPLIRDWYKELNHQDDRSRSDSNGERSNQMLFLPGMLPKIPGRFYYMFGKPIETKGMVEIVKDRREVSVLYSQIKSEIEKIISYLKKKRMEDPCRSILQRSVYQVSWNSSSTQEFPTFDP